VELRHEKLKSGVVGQQDQMVAIKKTVAGLEGTDESDC
jgi:hypothetical protein